jgi:hypothetical protein
MHVLDDGDYDAFIIDAEQRGDGLHIECAITTGARKGEVVNIVTSTFAARDALSLIGLPCTLVVRGDEVHVRE